MALEEEYTDYSCSTAIERLSRDVETILRVWHVDKGSDRHVSVNKGIEALRDAEDPSSTLIRSNPISWNVSVWTKEGRSSVTIDLELALWDAPRDMVLHEDEEDDDPLVRSLRRNPFKAMPSHEFLFDNFSSLFGIGQHISLTPIQPEPIPAGLVDSLGNSVLQRHSDQSTAVWAFGSVLSGWLQTALNCAVASCQCCIPAFGIWGLYQPNNLMPAKAKIPSKSNSRRTSRRELTSRQSNSRNSSNQSMSYLTMPSADSINKLSNQDELLGTTISMESSTIIATGVQVFPKWLHAVRSAALPTVGRKFRKRAQKHFWNHTFVPPFVTGSVICPGAPLDNPATAATMWISAAKNGIKASDVHNSIATNSRLAVWGSVLLQHCPDSTVTLAGARHVFGWFKERKRARSLFRNYDNSYMRMLKEWRRQADDEFEFARSSDDFDKYRKVCQAHALDMLEDAWGFREMKLPLWGPIDDPVASVYATVTWNGKSDIDGVVQPLLSFPLRIRSQRELSKRDWIDMEESVERTILDPLSPSRFCIQVYYDRDTSVATLAANQRCVLATLIRAATLPRESLLQHLTDEALVALWDDNAGTIVANKLAEKAKAGASTRQIVEAMDWSSMIEEMVSVRDAEELVHDIMSGKLTAAFPMSPEEQFNNKGLLSPFRKSAPWGRLLCILFARMAKLRSLSSIALVWEVFVQELRRRWEARESLPNMQYVPGLDPHPLELYEERCFSTIGRKANFAAFLNCSEPDPDDYNCLIGQKLQVFNLGVECIVAEEMLEHEAMERFLLAGEVPASAFMPEMGSANVSEKKFEMPEKAGDRKDLHVQQSQKKWPEARDGIGSLHSAKDYGPPTIKTDLEFLAIDEPGQAVSFDDGLDYVPPDTDITNLDSVVPPEADLTQSDTNLKEKEKDKNLKSIVVEGLPDQAWEGTNIEDGSVGSLATSCSMSQEYYDAAEAGSIFSMRNGFVSLDTVVNVDDMQRRPGARCPVQGVTLGTSGDQLYAPYLQRPFPLTDDLVLERRVMLTNERDGMKKKGRLQCRIDLAHRLQKPKLMSDMSAFKAANPNSTFDDFAGWYGNPGNPLDDYLKDTHPEDVSVQNSVNESAAKKLDKASEAMKVLMSTRDFWSNTWEEATPIPAAEQQPLFDFSSSVEMVIDYLEQMHPANLLNQVMAVNLSSAYFALVASADETLEIEIIKSTLQMLRAKVDTAVKLLSHDATGALFQVSSSRGVDPMGTTSNQYASEETINACEEACNALSVSETMMARATSLLSKFRGQHNLVNDLLKMADGSTVALNDHRGRSSFLDAIHKQQKQHSTFQSWDSLPKPVLREYVLRNIDSEHPCQLSVRFGDEGAYLDRVENEGGILIALMKSYSD